MATGGRGRGRSGGRGRGAGVRAAGGGWRPRPGRAPPGRAGAILEGPGGLATLEGAGSQGDARGRELRGIVAWAERFLSGWVGKEGAYLEGDRVKLSLEGSPGRAWARRETRCTLV